MREGPEGSPQNSLDSYWARRAEELHQRLSESGLDEEERKAINNMITAIDLARQFNFDQTQVEQALREAVTPENEEDLRAISATVRSFFMSEEFARSKQEAVPEPTPPTTPETLPAPEPAPEEEPVQAEAPEKGWSPKKMAAAVSEELKETAKEWAERLRSFGQNIPDLRGLTGKIKVPEFLKTLEKKKIFGQTAKDLLIYAGAGMAVRGLTRWGLGAATGGSGYLLAAGSGALAGGMIEGIKAYRQEKGREISRDEIVDKVIQMRESDLKDRLERYLDLTQAETPPEFSEEKNLLYQEFKKEFGVRRAEIVKGALRGAAIGAVGGVAGAYLADLAGEYLPKLKDYFTGAGGKEAIEGARKEIGEEALREMRERAADAYNKALEQAVEAGRTGLQEQAWTGVIDPSEGITHAAREAMHDYIVEQRKLGHMVSLEKAQLVYAEDALRKMFAERIVQPGEIFQWSGSALNEVIEKSRGLSEAELENLQKNWVGKIKDQTWQKILNYDSVINADNKFSQEILDRAAKEAAEASQKEAVGAGRGAAQDALLERGPSPAALKAKDTWFLQRSALLKIGAGVIAAQSALLLYLNREKVKATAGKLAAGAKEKTKNIHLPKVEMPKVSLGGVKKIPEKISSLFQRFERGRAGIKAAREKRRESEIEEEAKIKADPVYKFLAEEGIKLKSKEKFWYQGIKPDDLDKEEGEEVVFSNYSDYAKYLRGLTPEEREKAHRFRDEEDGEYYKSLGLQMSDAFFKKIFKDEDIYKKFTELGRKAAWGELPDEYEGENIPGADSGKFERYEQKRSGELTPAEKDYYRDQVEQLWREFHVLASSPVFYIENGEMTKEEAAWAWNLLREVLSGADQNLRQLLSRLTELGFSLGFGTHGLVRYPLLGGRAGGVLEIDPSLSPSEAKEFIRNTIEQLRPPQP